MKKNTIVFFVTIVIQQILQAQPSLQQRIEDSVIGWDKTYIFKGKQYKPLIVEGQTFSPYQQSLRDSFITWMQRSYVPIGGFGEIYQRDFTTRQNKGPVPQGIGMNALIYSLVKNERTGKYEMISNEDHNDISIYTNALAGINPVLLFNSPGGYFFTMPKENYASTFTDKTVIDVVREFGLHDDNRFSRFLVYFPSKSWVTVVLIPGNRLPIEQLTKGEVLNECEKRLAKEVSERKKEAQHMSSNNPSYYAEVIKDLDEKIYPQCIKNLSAIKEKYKDKLHEPAVLYYFTGPSLADFSSTSSLPTVFVEDWYQKIPGFPVYRFTKEAIENSKKDKPLWIAITWPPQKPDSRVKAYEVHRAMLRHFNFEYVYDYFFNPEKVKGIAYTPANAEEQKARIMQLKKHYTVTETKPLEKNVYFKDDFSATAEGSRPTGWNDSRGRTPAKVVSLINKPGKWVQLGHMNDLSAGTFLRKPLPGNFTLEFDVASDEFSVRTGGAVTVSLSTYQLTTEGWAKPNEKGTTLQVNIMAGNEADYSNNNYSGGAKATINSTIIGYEGGFNFMYGLREFTNKKTTIHAALQVRNGEVTLFINDKQVAVSKDFRQDYNNKTVCKGLPPGTLFRNLFFTNTTQNWSPDGKSNEVHVYISNVKITAN